MEPGGSLPHSQELTTCPYPDPLGLQPCQSGATNVSENLRPLTADDGQKYSLRNVGYELQLDTPDRPVRLQCMPN
jgi:hypothetical protein